MQETFYDSVRTARHWPLNASLYKHLNYKINKITCNLNVHFLSKVDVAFLELSSTKRLRANGVVCGPGRGLVKLIGIVNCLVMNDHIVKEWDQRNPPILIKR